jgi:hypothetical protein
MNVESGVSILRLMMDEMVLWFRYYIGWKLCHVAMLLLGFLSWLIVESIGDTTIANITTFGVNV